MPKLPRGVTTLHGFMYLQGANMHLQGEQAVATKDGVTARSYLIAPHGMITLRSFKSAPMGYTW
jgi:hypothetical protein